jgi:two-component sensor histidine kinase
MLEGLSEPVRVCHERALEAKCKADKTSDRALKASYLDMESGWLLLARSYAFTESINDFVAASVARRLEFDAKTEHQKPDSVLDERQLAQERELFRETNHRLKNLFAMIDAMINWSVRAARTPQEFAQALRGRLAALLRAKEVVRPGIMGTEHAASERTTVDALVRTILQPYDDDISRERISASGPDVVVGASAVTSLALALHESATNAVKYGALSEPNGAIRIKWETQGDDFRLDWEETGGPVIVAPPKADGFGSILTERSVTNQLRGKIEYDWRRNGLKLRVTIPLDRLGV